MAKNTKALLIALISGVTVITSDHLINNPFTKFIFVFLIVLAAALIVNRCFKQK